MQPQTPSEANQSDEAGLRGSGLKGRCKHIDHSTHDWAHVATIPSLPLLCLSLKLSTTHLPLSAVERFAILKKRKEKIKTLQHRKWGTGKTHVREAGRDGQKKITWMNEYRYVICISCMGGQGHTHTHTHLQHMVRVCTWSQRRLSLYII